MLDVQALGMAYGFFNNKPRQIGGCLSAFAVDGIALFAVAL